MKIDRRRFFAAIAGLFAVPTAFLASHRRSLLTTEVYRHSGEVTAVSIESSGTGYRISSEVENKIAQWLPISCDGHDWYPEDRLTVSFDRTVMINCPPAASTST